MKTTTINLHTRTDGMQPFRGYKFGNLAVHRDVVSQQAGRSKPDFWVVSHLPTGLLVQCVTTLKDGREFVEAVKDLDWSSDHNDTVVKTVKDDVIARRRELGYHNSCNEIRYS